MTHKTTTLSTRRYDEVHNATHYAEVYGWTASSFWSYKLGTFVRGGFKTEAAAKAALTRHCKRGLHRRYWCEAEGHESRECAC